MEPLQIIAFFDGRPGHEKQTRGIIRALKRMTPVTVTKVTVPIKSLSSALLDWLSFFCLQSLKRGPEKRESVSQLLIGTGSHTHLAMLAHPDRGKSRVVTCMTPAHCFLSSFDLCFVPEHDEVKERTNIFTTIGPPNTCYNRGHHDLEKGLIVVGGADEKSHTWNSETVVTQIQCIIEIQSNIQWTLSSSPRTPQKCNEMLKELAAKNFHASFFPFAETQPGWIEEKYDECTWAWVTADSMSMIFEALTAGCKVGILPVTWKKERNKFQKSVASLLAQKRVVSYEVWNEQKKSEKQPWANHPPLDEASRCAGEILERWWPSRLQ